MKKEQYLRLRIGYYQEAKEANNKMIRLREVFSDEVTHSEKLKSELDTISHSLSKMVFEIAKMEQDVLSLKNECKSSPVLDDQLCKAKDEMLRLKTTGKDLAMTMRKNGMTSMTKMIDEWISYCNVVSKQIR